ncbi:hypothetical protein [Paenibacillus sp. IHBB 10380]|uniref:hypothetical protein n=1 Tax=Paenibacillus sp. IHBB 10380 TaxID=1566358 RepID=UPI0005CFA543|nr:hypothetical protein [Paenibacillus sp. IHBB 10380]AJS58093.1 hypothetical protein UB51_05800 [Paenibacillus sp. IHBB 10380]
MVKTLKALGIISIIGGIIVGIIYGTKEDPLAKLLEMDDSFRFAVALSWWVSGLVSGILFLAFSKMLELLEWHSHMLKELMERNAR